MKTLLEIQEKYCLKMSLLIRFNRNNSFRPIVTGVKLISYSGTVFIGVGKDRNDIHQNCVEVFEIHQELLRKGLLTTKNLN